MYLHDFQNKHLMFWTLVYSNLDIVSDFDIRISDFN